MRDTLDLDAIAARTKTASKEIDRVAQGGRWKMCVPVEKTDSDVLLSAVINDVDDLLTEVRRLRAIERHAVSENEIVLGLLEANEEMGAEIVRLRAALDRVCALHADDGNGTCIDCWHTWPCITYVESQRG